MCRFLSQSQTLNNSCWWRNLVELIMTTKLLRQHLNLFWWGTANCCFDGIGIVTPLCYYLQPYKAVRGRHIFLIRKSSDAQVSNYIFLFKNCSHPSHDLDYIFFYLFLVQNGFLLFQKISLLWKNVHFFRIFQDYYRHTHDYRVSFNAWRLLNWMSCLNEESMYPFLVVIELQLQCPIMLRRYDRVSRWSSTIREFYWDLSAKRLGFSLLAGL